MDSNKAAESAFRVVHSPQVIAGILRVGDEPLHRYAADLLLYQDREIERLRVAREQMESTLAEDYKTADGKTVHWTPWGLVIEAPIRESDIQRGIALATERGWARHP